MPEILTESFCERCGTRYTFESAAPKAKRLGRFKVLSQGLKNFVMSDDASLDEALAAARNDEERETVAQQLDAFHKTFNFCMNCRQYTCSNCWNDAEGRCLTCSPHLGHEILPAAFPNLQAGNGADRNGQPDVLAWPTSDLQPQASAPLAWPDAADAAPLEGAASPSIDLPDWASTSPTVESGAADASALADEAALPDDAWLTDVEARLGGAPPLPAVESEATPAVSEQASEPPPVAEAEVREMVEAEASTASADSAAELIAPTEQTAVEEAGATEDTTKVEETAGAGPELPVVDDIAALAEVQTDRLAQTGPEAQATPSTETAPGGEPEAPLADDDQAAVEDRAAAAAAQTAKLLARFRPGQSIDAALDEYEAALAAQETAAASSGSPPPADTLPTAEIVAQAARDEPVEALIVSEADEPGALELEPLAADELEADVSAVGALEPHTEPEPAAAEAVAPQPAEPEPVAEAEAEPVAEAEPEPIAAAEPEPVAASERAAELEPVSAATEPEPVSAATPEEPVAPAATPGPPAPPADDRVEVPVWTVVAPDVDVPVANGHPTDAAIPTAASAQQPEWPAAPAWPATEQQVDVSFLAARLSKKPSNDALWAASSRDVLAPLPQQPAQPAVQTCVSCGLSLSATARFCRRCGSRQES